MNDLRRVYVYLFCFCGKCFACCVECVTKRNAYSLERFWIRYFKVIRSLRVEGRWFVVVFLQKLDSLEMAQEAYIFLEYLTVLDVV